MRVAAMTIEMRKMTIFGLEITGDSPDRCGRILILILLGFTVFNYIYNGLFRPLSTEKVDFVAYYNAAMAFRYGLPIYEHMIRFFEEGVLGYQGPFPYVYPPSFVIFLNPLAYLSFKQASLLWILFNHLCFFFSMILLMKAIKRQYAWIEWMTLMFVSMNFTPLFMDYLVGQCNIILLFLMTIGLYYYRANKGILVGIALALATMIKIIPILLVGFMLWKRQYKAFMSAVIVLLLIFLYSLFFFDADLFLWYFKFMAGQDLFSAYHDNHSLTGFFSRFLVHSVWTKGTFNNPGAATVCILLTSSLMLFLLFYLTKAKKNDSVDSRLREYSLVVTTMLLTSKMTSTPYLVMLLIPIVVLVHELLQSKTGSRWIYPLGAAYGILAIWYPLPVGKFLDMDVYRIYMKGLRVHIFSLQFFAMFVIWLYFAIAPLSVAKGDATHGTHNKADHAKKHHGSI